MTFYKTKRDLITVKIFFKKSRKQTFYECKHPDYCLRAPECRHTRRIADAKQ